MPGPRHKVVRPHGQLRRSQMVGAFGPGAMVDLPKHAVLIGGLEDWGDPERTGMQGIYEERLRSKLEERLQIKGLRFYAPPIELERFSERPVGVTAWQFPEWFVAPYEFRNGNRARPILHRRALVDGRYFSPERKKKLPVQPMRFVQACVLGHISDIDWPAFAHRGERSCSRQLWLLERGTTGDFLDIFVECDCGKFPSRTLLEATKADENGKPSLGFCQGKRPWLGNAAREKCGGDEGKPQLNKLLVRAASNSYFAQTYSVISIPERNLDLRKAVEALWDDYLAVAENAQDVKRERRKTRVEVALRPFKDAEVWAEIQRRKNPAIVPEKKIKEAELETLLSAQDEVGEDAPHSDFHARTLPLNRRAVPSPRPSPLSGERGSVLENVERVVLVHRLREVIAQVGFTRFEASNPDIDGELDLGVRSGALARELSWLPAIENHGEGVFVAFKREAIQSWLARPAVKKRGQSLDAGFSAWALERKLEGVARFPGLPYVFLHSLSHLLITAMSLEAGYGASAIRERVYANETGYGILLHTGTTDSEGTLGGLVQMGRRIEEVLEHALELGKLCSNDPICAQHEPHDANERRFLHGAACHGCLLTSEPSCERRNELLDRALIVPTVTDLAAEFFQGLA